MMLRLWSRWHTLGRWRAEVLRWHRTASRQSQQQPLNDVMPILRAAGIYLLQFSHPVAAAIPTHPSPPTVIITAPISTVKEPEPVPATPAKPFPKLHTVTEHFPPFQIKQTKVLDGWAVQRVKALLTQANLSSNIEVLPWPRAYKVATTRPNTLIFSLLKTEERQAQFHWIAPLCPMHIGFYTTETRSDISATTIDALKPYVIGVERGQANQHYLQKNGFIVDKNLVLVQHKDVLHQMLALGRVDVVLLSQHYVQQWQLQHPNQPALKPLFIAEDLAQMLYIAAHIDSDPALIAQLTHAWQQLAMQPQAPCPSDTP